MEKLNELVNIVNRIKTQKIELLGKGNSKYSKLTSKLYDGIVSGKYGSEEEAAIDIYGTDFTPNNFAHLKKNLTKKLLNTLFFIDVSDIHLTDFQKIHIAAERQRSAIRILLARGAKSISIGLAEKLLKTALKFEFTEISLELSRILLRHYRTHDINPEKEKKYDAIVNDTLQIFLAEIEVDKWIGLSAKTLANSKITRIQKVKIITNYAKKINNIFPKIQSFKIGRLAYSVLIIEQEIQNNHKGIIQVCKSAINYFEKKKVITSKQLIIYFYINLLAAYIPLRKFIEGEKIAKSTLITVTEGSLNWYLTLDYYFLLSMHTLKYEKGLEIYNQAINHKSFRTLLPEFKELWKIYEAYLAYLQQVNKLGRKETQQFKIAKFMNEVPIFSKDKKGVNVAIIIIQILFLIAQGKEIKIIDKVESLRMYVHAHLRNDDSLRSNIFIKMLLNMVKSNFHKVGTLRRTAQLREKLEKTPMASKGQSKYVEIIPYEILWEINLSFLSNRAF